MKKNLPIHKDEIDLIALLIIIWDGKIKILLITIISFLIGFGYDFQTPRNYLNSLTLHTSDNNEFLKLNNIQKLLNKNQSSKTNEKYLLKFIEKLENYEEFLFSIKNTKKIKENFLNLKIEQQKIELFKYAGLLNIVKPKKDKQHYTFNFKWHDPNEAKKILQDTLNLTSINLKKSINHELSQTLEFEKELTLNNDKKRLAYLKEQSAIAKELNIIDNQIDNVNLTRSSVSLNISTADIAYYLRGYKAIDKEIELIQNRNYEYLTFIQQEIDTFKKENIKWVNYNIHLMDSVSLKNTKLILVISILLGFIVGIFYVLISKAFSSKKTI